MHKARQLSANRIVALKLIRAGSLPDSVSGQLQQILTRFRTEAEATAQREHDHVVPIYDVGEIDSRPYYAMRFVEGESLSQRMKDEPADPRQAARYIQQNIFSTAALSGEVRVAASRENASSKQKKTLSMMRLPEVPQFTV